MASGIFGSLRLRHFGPRPLIEDNSRQSKSTSIVPPTVFWPQPDVESAVVRLSPGASWTDAEYRPFVATVKALFGHRRKQLGAIWRQCMGQHYPAMSMIFVADLLDNPGKIELEATAVVPVS